MIDIYEIVDIKLMYLSSYSSDFNSIEEIFMRFKVWCKKYRKEAEICEFEEFLKYTMKNMKDDTWNHFI